MAVNVICTSASATLKAKPAAINGTASLSIKVKPAAINATAAATIKTKPAAINATATAKIKTRPAAINATVYNTLSTTQASVVLGRVQSISDPAVAVDTVTESATRIDAVTDSVTASDSVINTPQENISDAVNASDTITEVQTLTTSVVDVVEATDDSPTYYTTVLTDTVTASDAVYQPHTEQISDIVLALDIIPPYTFTEIVSDSAVASDDSPVRWANQVSDVVEAADTVIDTVSITESISDPVTATDSIAQLSGITERISDSAIVIDLAISAPSLITSAVSDEVIATDTLYSVNPSAIAWIVNTETGAPSYYDNFDFISLTEQNGMLFGAGPDGLYLLEGESDSGTSIQSELKTGFLNFQSDQKKRLPNIYFGYTGGELECDVETYDQPNDIYTYNLEEREASAPRNNRIQIGKGLVGRFWRLTLRNTSGEAFQVYDTTADVVQSKRRL